MDTNTPREKPAPNPTSSVWTPRSRFEGALRGEMPDRVPAVIWNNKLPGDETDQALLDAGACIVYKSSLYDVEFEGIQVELEEWQGQGGYTRRRTTYHTPYGSVQKVDALYPGTVWHEEVPFRSPKDYDALIAVIESQAVIPRYDRFLEHDAYYGNSGIARPATEVTPMLDIIYRLLGVETFALEWFDRRDHVLALYKTLLDARRRKLPVLAASPASHFVIEANVTFDIVGPQRFKEFYIPAIEEACDVLHASGKLTGAHLDSNNRRWASLVAPTSVDFIESFTPPPDCDMSISAAREAWPNKTLYCNFPSSVHHAGPAAVRSQAKDLLGEAAPGAGFLLGVLENVPRSDTMVTLVEAIWEHGKTPLRS